MSLRWIFFLVINLVTASAAAQFGAPTAGGIDPARVAALYVTAEAGALPVTATPTPLSDRNERTRIQASRNMIAHGGGMVLGSAIGLAFGGRQSYCHYQDITLRRTAPRIVGSVLMAAGATLMIAGGVRLKRIAKSSREGVDMSQGKKIGTSALALGLAALAAMSVGTATFIEGSQCWNS